MITSPNFKNKLNKLDERVERTSRLPNNVAVGKGGGGSDADWKTGGNSGNPGGNRREDNRIAAVEGSNDGEVCNISTTVDGGGRNNCAASAAVETSVELALLRSTTSDKAW